MKGSGAVDLEEALRDSLGPLASDAELPKGARRVPDAGVRQRRPSHAAGAWIAAAAVVVIAVVATSTALTPSPSGQQLGTPSGQQLETEGPGTPLPSASDQLPPPSTIPQATPFIPDLPPEVAVNGVAGKPFSWCYGNACADGAFQAQPLDILPAWPGSPAIITFGEPGTVVGAEVYGADAVRVAVPFDGTTIGVLPPGTWERILVSVQYAGGNATYSWRVGPADG